MGRIELITSETKRAVEEAIAKSDWPTIGRYSRFLDPILKRIPSLEGKQIEQVRRSVQSSNDARACR